MLDTYNDCADEVHACKVRLAQIGCVSTERLFGDMIMVKSMAASSMLVGEAAFCSDFFAILLLVRHDLVIAHSLCVTMSEGDKSWHCCTTTGFGVALSIANAHESWSQVWGPQMPQRGAHISQGRFQLAGRHCRVQRHSLTDWSNDLLVYKREGNDDLIGIKGFRRVRKAWTRSHPCGLASGVVGDFYQGVDLYEKGARVMVPERPVGKSQWYKVCRTYLLSHYSYVMVSDRRCGTNQWPVKMYMMPLMLIAVCA